MKITINAKFIDMRDRGVECSLSLQDENGRDLGAGVKRILYGKTTSAETKEEAAVQALTWAVAVAAGRIHIKPEDIT